MLFRSIREYYLNDCGHQINLLVESVEEREKEINHQKFHLPEDGYQGEYIKDIAHLSSSLNKGKLREFILSQITMTIKNELSHLGIEFDNWFSQRELINSGQVDKVLSFLKAKDFVYEKDGAYWFASSRFGDDKDRVLRKNNGEIGRAHV